MPQQRNCRCEQGGCHVILRRLQSYFWPQSFLQQRRSLWVAYGLQLQAPTLQCTWGRLPYNYPSHHSKQRPWMQSSPNSCRLLQKSRPHRDPSGKGGRLDITSTCICKQRICHSGLQDLQECHADLRLALEQLCLQSGANCGKTRQPSCLELAHGFCSKFLATFKHRVEHLQ